MPISARRLITAELIGGILFWDADTLSGYVLKDAGFDIWGQIG